MLNIFRLASLLEGLSFLLILSVSVGLVSRDLVFALGMGHGVLFLVYVALSLGASHKQAWPLFTWLLVFLAAVVPFAFIAVELFIKRELAKDRSAHSKPG
jgi:integral membrane protein